MRKKRSLTLKQQAFADFYIELGNAYQAAIKADYSENYARAQSHKLLDNVGVKAYVDTRMEEIKTERVADQQEILEFLTSVIRGNAKGKLKVGVGQGAEKIEDVEPSLQEKIRAAEQLGKRYGMWTDRQEMELKLPMFVDDVNE